MWETHVTQCDEGEVYKLICGLSSLHPALLWMLRMTEQK